MTLKKVMKDQHKCEHCLYLLKREETIKNGENHVKYKCMLIKCVKEKEGDGGG